MKPARECSGSVAEWRLPSLVMAPCVRVLVEGSALYDVIWDRWYLVRDVLLFNICLAESVCACSPSRLAGRMVGLVSDMFLLQVRPAHAGWSLVRTRPPTKDRKKWQAGAMVKGRNEPASLVQILEVVAGKASFALLLLHLCSLHFFRL